MKFCCNDQIRFFSAAFLLAMKKTPPLEKKDITTKLSFSQKEEKKFLFLSLNGFAQKFWEEKKREWERVRESEGEWERGREREREWEREWEREKGKKLQPIKILDGKQFFFLRLLLLFIRKNRDLRDQFTSKPSPEWTESQVIRVPNKPSPE